MEWAGKLVDALAWCVNQAAEYKLGWLVYRIYVLFKWVKHQAIGYSHLESLCRLNDEDVWVGLWNINVQFDLSKKLQDPLSEMSAEAGYGIEDAAKSICSIKKITVEYKRPFRKLELAIAIRRALDAATDRVAKDTATPTKWNDNQSQFEGMVAALKRAATELSLNLSSEKGNLGINWVKLGFQGKDPCTDFRATGMFGLNCFRELCVQDPGLTAELLMESGSTANNAKAPWYPLALVSIHLSQTVSDALTDATGYRRQRARGRLVGLRHDDDDEIEDTVIMPFLLGAKEDRIEEVQGELSDALHASVYSLHQLLVRQFHGFWRSEVKAGKVTSVIEVEGCLGRFKKRRGWS